MINPTYKTDGTETYKNDGSWYCCQCDKDTNGLSTCHDCGHMKGRWKTDKNHHCKDVLALKLKRLKN